MKYLIKAFLLSACTPLFVFSQTNPALQIKKDTVKVNAANLLVENNLMLRHLKNNATGDSVITTDANGNLMLKKFAASQTGGGIQTVGAMTVAYGIDTTGIEPLVFEVTAYDGTKVTHAVSVESYDQFFDQLATPAKIVVKAINRHPGKALDLQIYTQEGYGNSSALALYGDTVALQLENVYGKNDIYANYRDSASAFGGDYVLGTRLHVSNETIDYQFSIRGNSFATDVLPGNSYHNKCYFNMYAGDPGAFTYQGLTQIYYFKSGGGIATAGYDIKRSIRLIVKKNGEIYSNTVVDPLQSWNDLPQIEIGDGSWQDVEFIIQEVN